MEENEKIKQELRKIIKDNPESFPFIAHFWEIEVTDGDLQETPCLEFGKYNAKLVHSRPFYKPYSKIIDISKLE